LDITYKNKRIEKVCTDAKTAEKTYGQDMADKIHQRVDEINAADTVELMIQFRIGRCHPLSQNRKGQYAVDLVHPYRLVFEKKGGEIQIANILEIVDYH
jgi:proteic killer suppression protein